MKFILLVALLLFSSIPVFAVDEKPEIPVAEQATQGLFERVRGAHLRAVQRGVIFSLQESVPATRSQ